jgi:hypothetical protein
MDIETAAPMDNGWINVEEKEKEEKREENKRDAKTQNKLVIHTAGLFIRIGR